MSISNFISTHHKTVIVLIAIFAPIGVIAVFHWIELFLDVALGSTQDPPH